MFKWALIDWLMNAYIVLFSAFLSRLTALACGSTFRVTRFFLAHFFWISTEVVYLQCWHGWCHMKNQLSRHKFCVHHTTMYHVTSCKATCIRTVYACLGVTCHLHFWQNDRDLLRATAVTWGWNRYRNKSQHRKLTLEKKIFLQGFESATFQSRVWRSNHWAIPDPLIANENKNQVCASVSAEQTSVKWAPPVKLNDLHCQLLELHFHQHHWTQPQRKEAVVEGYPYFCWRCILLGLTYFLGYQFVFAQYLQNKHTHTKKRLIVMYI